MKSMRFQDAKSTKTSVVLLYTNDELFEEEIKKKILSIIMPKRIKYLGINLIKEVKDLYTINYKILMKEIKMTQIERHSMFMN